MADKNFELLHQAIARNVGAVLSLPSAGMLRHCKTRFVGELEGGVLLEAPKGELLLIQELIRTGTPCGVSFRSGVFKAMFAAPLLRMESDWRINAETMTDAVLLAFPSQIKAQQRRTTYRVDIPPDTDISIRIWRIAEKAYLKEQPMAAQEIKTEIRDLSVGGVGVRLIGKDKELPCISTADRLRIVLGFRDQSLVLEGRMRSTGETKGNMLVTGIQFKKLENDMDGRRNLTALTRIVGELQRAETRRVRLGLSRAG